MQILAARAIRNLGEKERKASVNDLLLMITRTNPNDLRRHTGIEASFTLFSYPENSFPKSILEDSLEGVDRARLYPCVRTLLQHQDSIARRSVSKTFPLLTETDIVELLPDIQRCTEKIAPSNEMYADGSILAGLDLLSRLHIAEGLELCVSTIQPERWGEKKRTLICLGYLKRYGSHAKKTLPQLREIRDRLVKEKKASASYLADFDKALAEIEDSEDVPVLVDMNDFKASALK
jgi:hypothetical protein